MEVTHIFVNGAQRQVLGVTKTVLGTLLYTLGNNEHVEDQDGVAYWRAPGQLPAQVDLIVPFTARQIARSVEETGAYGPLHIPAGAPRIDIAPDPERRYFKLTGVYTHGGIAESVMRMRDRAEADKVAEHWLNTPLNGGLAFSSVTVEEVPQYKCALCGQRINDGKPCGCGARREVSRG